MWPAHGMLLYGIGRGQGGSLDLRKVEKGIITQAAGVEGSVLYFAYNIKFQFEVYPE